MNPTARFDRYRDLQAYIGWTAADAQRVAALRAPLQPFFEELIDDFYEEIARHEEARRVITGGQAQIERLKQTLRVWVDELLAGVYDEAYVERRWRVGWRHVEIGLNQVYTNAALSRLRSGLARAIEITWQGSAEELPRSLASLHKLLDLDLAIIEDAYQAEYLRRAQQVERLAAIGQMAGGVAHELRQPLNVIKTSAYYLLNAKRATPEKMREHLERIDAQVGLADGVINAMANYARLPLPDLRSTPVCECVQNVLSSQTLPDTVEVTVECDSAPPVLTDPAQLAIVLGNLIRNGCDAMPSGGKLEIKARTLAEASQDAEGEHTVAILVSDTGTGIPPDELERIMEPLYTTKPRGMGLGLSIARGILDKLGGTLQVESELGRGSTFTIVLPAASEVAPPERRTAHAR